MFTQTIEMTRSASAESYQMIQDEQLESLVIASQILAGSHILLSTYEQVVFSDCVFYACSFQGVSFKNCVFENCNFEFSHFKNCHFENCSFNNSTWKASSSTKSTYLDCSFWPVLHTLLENGQNQISTRAKDHDYTTDIYIELLAAA